MWPDELPGFFFIAESIDLEKSFSLNFMIHFCPFSPWLLEYMSSIIKHTESSFCRKGLEGGI